MKDHGISINIHCPCEQKHCPIRGNCVVCVQNHLVHRRHIPVCFQNVLRDNVKELAALLELKTEEGRPSDEFWEKHAKTDFLVKSLNRHESNPDSD